MLKEKGEDLIISLKPLDPEGNPAEGDTPYITMKDLESGLYYNGIAWVSEEYRIPMQLISNGIYSYTLTLYDIGKFEVIATSSLYPDTNVKAVNIEVYNPDSGKMPWVINKEYTILFGAKEGSALPTVSIQRMTDDMYLTAEGEWVQEEQRIPMIKEEEIYSYKFTPIDPANYFIKCMSSENEDDGILTMILEVFASEEEITPVSISWKTILSLDGSNSLITDGGSEKTLGGVKITIYDLATRELINSTLSNSDGTWEMMARPSRYIFIFERAGYSSVVFEREVV